MLSGVGFLFHKFQECPWEISMSRGFEVKLPRINENNTKERVPGSPEGNFSVSTASLRGYKMETSDLKNTYFFKFLKKFRTQNFHKNVKKLKNEDASC